MAGLREQTRKAKHGKHKSTLCSLKIHYATDTKSNRFDFIWKLLLPIDVSVCHALSRINYICVPCTHVYMYVCIGCVGACLKIKKRKGKCFMTYKWCLILRREYGDIHISLVDSSTNIGIGIRCAGILLGCTYHLTHSWRTPNSNSLAKLTIFPLLTKHSFIYSLCEENIFYVFVLFFFLSVHYWRISLNTVLRREPSNRHSRPSFDTFQEHLLDRRRSVHRRHQIEIQHPDNIAVYFHLNPCR